MASQLFLRSATIIALTAGLVACSSVDHAIISTENGASRIFAGGQAANPPPPSIDTQTLSWQKLSAASAVQFAIVGGTQATPGATRVALKVPAGDAVPLFWQDVPQSYIVLSGTFMVEGVDGSGRPEQVTQTSGASAKVPARMIERVSATSAGEGILLVTVFGEWKPNFVADTAPPPQMQRASN